MPAAQLQWYINGEKADPVHIQPYKILTIDGLLTSRLGLSFKVRLNFKGYYMSLTVTDFTNLLDNISYILNFRYATSIFKEET